MFPEEIRNPLPEDPSQGRITGFPLLHHAALNCINQQVDLKIRLHTAGLLVTQEDLVDDNCLRHYVLELSEIAISKPPAQIIMIIRDWIIETREQQQSSD
jgi:hypothetical protein